MAEGLLTRPISVVPKGTALSRLLMALGDAGGDTFHAQLTAARWKDTPTVAAVLDKWHTKAAVAAGVTSDATFAGPLAVYGVASEALAIERGISIVGQLAPKMRRVPFRTKVPRETGTGTGGAWVGENLSTPAAATAFDTLSQEAYKAQKIVVLSRELLQLGNPNAERTVRETVMAGMAAYLDAQFLTNTVTLSANLRPAAITNGATAVTSTGSTAAQINADLSAMLALITTAGAGLTWIMRPMTAYKIAATIGGTAAVDVPRSLFGIPLVLSLNSPAQITLVDAACILYSDDDGFDVDVTEQALLQMSDAPTDPPVAATVFESLWQDNLWAVKVTRWLAYLRAQTGSVTYMTVAY
jgi:Phage capsid family